MNNIIMKNRTWKVVCIGAGYFAKFHIEAWKRIPNVALVAICDLNIDKARLLATEFQIPNAYTTLAAANDTQSFDIVDIITPPETHKELCLQSAALNVHVICQKPLAPNIEEAKELIDSMNRSEVRFMVHENFRFQPWHRKLKELLDKGAIGDEIFQIHHRMRMGDGWPDDAYLARQPYFRTMPRLLIHETGIHFVDVFRYLLGDVNSIYSRLRKLNKHIAGEDSAVVLFEFENGCQGIFDANRYNEVAATNPRYTFGETLIEGNQGSIRLDLEGSIFIKKLGECEIEIQYEHSDINFSGDCVFFTQQHFIDCLQSGDEFETNANDYMKNLIIQEAIYESAQTGKEIVIEKNISAL